MQFFVKGVWQMNDLLKAKLLVMIAVLALAGCATTSGSNPAEKRQTVQNMKNEVLAELYQVKPAARAEIAAAPGYAVFSNANVNVIFASFGGGYGVVTDKSGKTTYMKMGEAGIGLGMGVKDFRAVFVFRDRGSLDRFVNSGWEFGGHADAAAKAGDKGAAVGGEALIDGINIYQFTKAGLALQATVKGIRYWKDDELN
jgi:lipid-binding SYLF domain-containing protein